MADTTSKHPVATTSTPRSLVFLATLLLALLSLVTAGETQAATACPGEWELVQSYGPFYGAVRSYSVVSGETMTTYALYVSRQVGRKTENAAPLSR